MGNLGRVTTFWFTRKPRRTAESSTTPGRNLAAAATIRIFWNRLTQPRSLSSPAPAIREPPTTREPTPPSENPTTISRTPPAIREPPPENPHRRERENPAHRPRLRRALPPPPPPASDPPLGRAAPVRAPAPGLPKVPIMTAAHSGTPAAVFVYQHTHSITNLRQTQYPHLGMRKIFCRLPGSYAEGRNCASSQTRATTAPPPRRNAARQHDGSAARTSENRHREPRGAFAFTLADAGARGGLIRATGGSPGTRTRNLRIKSPMLCQIELATRSKCTPSGRLSGNRLRRAGREAGALRGHRRGRGQPRPGG